MKMKLLFAMLVCLSLLSIDALAQGDPWIHQAYKELYNRQPSAAELNINNYNRGTWANYAQLKTYVQSYQASLNSSGLKGDPWIFQIYKEAYNRNPNALELNIKNYNGGSWSNYADLKKYVQEFQTSLVQSGITISSAIVNNVAIVALKQNGQQVAVAALSLNSGQIIASDGAGIISGGAGNIISGGAGNLIGQDGAGITVSPAMGGISFGSSYTIQSENTNVIKSGNGSLIINRKR